jgi:hypothetical protein
MPTRHSGCSYCHKKDKGLLHCAKCKSVSYCNRECQKADWGEGHKDECRILGPAELVAQRFQLIMFKIANAESIPARHAQAARAQIRLQADRNLLRYATDLCRGDLTQSTNEDAVRGLRVTQLLVLNAERWDILPRNASRAVIKARLDSMHEYHAYFGDPSGNELAALRARP